MAAVTSSCVIAICWLASSVDTIRLPHEHGSWIQMTLQTSKSHAYTWIVDDKKNMTML